MYPTRHGNGVHSFIDLFLISPTVITQHLPGLSHFLQTDPFESDHDALILNIVIGKPCAQDPVTIHNFGGADWKALNLKIDNGILEIDLQTEI